MNMLKLILLLFVMAVPAALADAGCDNIHIVNFNYDDGIITYKDGVIKCGYVPDRKIQPAEGYKAEIISIDNNALYSFKFKIPLDINLDLSDAAAKSLSGGIIVLNTTDFALIFPYYDDAKSIVIYNPNGYEIRVIPLIEDKFMQRKTPWLWFFLVLTLLAVMISLVYRHFREPKQPVQPQYGQQQSQYYRR